MTYKLAKTSQDADPYFGAVSLLLDGTDLQDKSLNTKAITVNGDAQVSTTQSKWNGSSLAFDGTGDYLSIPNSSDFRMGSDPFTIEGYLYINSASGEDGIVTLYGYNDNRRSYDISLSGGNFRFRTSSNGSGSTLAFEYTQTPLQQWFHFAVVKSSTTGTLYINGTQVASGTTDATLYDNTVDDIVIGNLGPYGASYFLNGYLQDLRITKGVARYTANFTPPTQPFTPAAVAPDYDPYFFPNVSLLLHGDGTNGSTNIVDSSYPAKTITVNGDAQISTAQSKFGGSSLAFDGTGDYLSITDSADFDFGSGDFTVEFWVYIKTSGQTDVLVVKRNSNAVYAPFMFILLNGDLQARYSTTGSSWSTTTIKTNANISTNTWHHVAMARSGSSFTGFYDGQSVAMTSSSSSLISNTDDLVIGGDKNANYFDGYIDDIRLTKGIARYTSDFTPPTKALPNY